MGEGHRAWNGEGHRCEGGICAAVNNSHECFLVEQGVVISHLIM